MVASLGVYNLIGNVWEFVESTNNKEDVIGKGGVGQLN